MKCNWCRKGKGRNYTKDKEGRIFYYYCQECIGQIECDIIPPKLIEEFLEFLKFKAGTLEGCESLTVFNKKDYEKELEKWEKRLKEK